MAERRDGGDTTPQKDRQTTGAIGATPGSASAAAGAGAGGLTGTTANNAMRGGASGSQAASSGATSTGTGAGGAGKGNGNAGRAARGGGQSDADAASAVREGAQEMADEARGVTDQLAGEIRSAAESLLDEGKGRAIDTVHGVAQALRKTAEGLQEAEGGEFVARYAEQAADQIERFTDSLRDRHLGDIVADIDDFARRQPTLFLLGAVAAGFVVGRFMAASSERRHQGAAQGMTTARGDYRSRHGREAGEGRTGMAGYGAGAYGTRGTA